MVRDPVSRVILPAVGAEVEDSSYWRRRLGCGDVVMLDDEIKAAPAGDHDGQPDTPTDDDQTGDKPGRKRGRK